MFTRMWLFIAQCGQGNILNLIKLLYLEKTMFHESRRVYGKVKDLSLASLKKIFSQLPYVKAALLFGSRAMPHSAVKNSKSDYDFAVLMDKSEPCGWGHLAKLRTDLGSLLSLPDEDFDIIDLEIAQPPLLDSIKMQYLVIKGDFNEIRYLFGKHPKNAESEKEVLDILFSQLQSNNTLGKIELRAARASLQILIENAIGKARRILKHYNCPIVASRGRDAFEIMYNASLIDDEQYQNLMQAVGFRNAMIHDYMNFDETILIKIIAEQKYLNIYNFLIEYPDYSNVQRSRIENFNF